MGRRSVVLETESSGPRMSATAASGGIDLAGVESFSVLTMTLPELNAFERRRTRLEVV